MPVFRYCCWRICEFVVVSEDFFRGALNVCVSVGAWFSEEANPNLLCHFSCNAVLMWNVDMQHH